MRGDSLTNSEQIKLVAVLGTVVAAVLAARLLRR